LGADPYADVQRLPGLEVAGLAYAAAPRRLRIEQLPKPLLCIPLVLQWLYLAARYRSLTLPSCLNPRIETGGLAGESKSACLSLIGSGFAPWVAPWCRIASGEDPVVARVAAGLHYPLIVKPDIGWCGYGVRRINCDAALAGYAGCVPAGGAFILQRLIEAPNEAGLLYIREPGALSGTLAAMTLRHAPRVIGDGRRSIRTLVGADPRLRAHSAIYAATIGKAGYETVPAMGERVILTTIASLRIGARYEDASTRISPMLAARIDAIAASMADFHYGRFDVRFDNLASLLAGDFSIIEVNGAGSEAIQFWDPALAIGAAFRGVFAKQRQIFKLGDAMREAGHRPTGAVALARAWLRQQRLLRRYPPST
jgi:hypothetical protein